MEQKKYEILRRSANWKNLYFYQKADTLYQLTFVFCERFMAKYGDRTVDQMIQAARSGKQNIVEGSEDGKTSTEMELKLLNVARSSIDELREDYKDFISSRNLPLWDKSNPRFAKMQEFTKKNNTTDQYEEYLYKWSLEEMANIGLTLCYQVDAMMNSYLQKLEKEFVSKGGIKERMHAARTGFRKEQDEKMTVLEKKVAEQDATIKALIEENAILKTRYDELHEKASKAYLKLKKELEEAKKKTQREK